MSTAIRTVADYLAVTYAKLIWTEYLALRRATPSGQQQVCVTHAGQVRCTELNSHAVREARHDDDSPDLVIAKRLLDHVKAQGFHTASRHDRVECRLAAHLSARNLLRGYRLRMPTGQAVAGFLGLPVLSPEQLLAASGSAKQEQAGVLPGGAPTRASCRAAR